MNITFAPKDAKFIKDQVKSGEYSNASEVVRDAVRRLREKYDALYPEIVKDHNFK